MTEGRPLLRLWSRTRHHRQVGTETEVVMETGWHGLLALGERSRKEKVMILLDHDILKTAGRLAATQLLFRTKQWTKRHENKVDRQYCVKKPCQHGDHPNAAIGLPDWDSTLTSARLPSPIIPPQIAKNFQSLWPFLLDFPGIVARIEIDGGTSGHLLTLVSRISREVEIQASN